MSDFNSAEGSPSSGPRVKGVTVVKPIVFGNVSKNFGKKREGGRHELDEPRLNKLTSLFVSDGHTHEWTVYVKPFDNEDMSNYVKKVQFRLHESYANPNRIVSKPPYEVSAILSHDTSCF